MVTSLAIPFEAGNLVLVPKARVFKVKQQGAKTILQLSFPLNVMFFCSFYNVATQRHDARKEERGAEGGG